MSNPTPPRLVHVVSHGPHCLDGVAAAVAVARYRSTSEVRPYFSGNPKINEILCGLKIDEPLADQELWITDISWTAPEADAHLRRLAGRGLPIFWIDHHRTAIERLKAGSIDVPFKHRIVDDRYAASRLVFEYLQQRLRAEGRENRELESFAPVVRMADDNDRWLHQVPGSWELALTVRAMNGPEAFEDLLHLDEQATYTPRMQAAYDRVAAELERSFEIADRSRTLLPLSSGLQVVGAVCDGYPSEIADRWVESSRTPSSSCSTCAAARSAIVARRIARSISPLWLRPSVAAGTRRLQDARCPTFAHSWRAPPASASRTS